ncbi:aldo/keto reductase [Rhodohalobacter sp. 8-1]|uniref:aldo/keto reductase n=1 Tax=Rhodohalobacter sp. 8-1 TaxID=3131972 RepID=UPI0030EF65A5
MDYKLLGNTGLFVSELSFGTMSFGGEGMWKSVGQQQQDEADELIQMAVDAGINFIDTANVYSFGQSEEILGNSIDNLDLNLNELVISTKVRGAMGEGPNDQGLSRYHIFNSAEDSLTRLNVDQIDLLYVHGVDSVMPIEEIMHSLNDLVDTGYVRYLGVSNWPTWMVAKANEIARSKGWHQFKAMQYYYSLSGRDAEDALIPYAESENLAFVPWSPLAGGFLTGKYTREKEESGENARRDEFDFPPIDKEKAYAIVDLLREIADSYDVSIAETALAWVRHKPGVTSTLIGAKSTDQLESNLRSAEIELTDEDLQALDEISAIPKRYPFWMAEFQNQNRYPGEEREM